MNKYRRIEGLPETPGFMRPGGVIRFDQGVDFRADETSAPPGMPKAVSNIAWDRKGGILKDFGWLRFNTSLHDPLALGFHLTELSIFHDFRFFSLRQAAGGTELRMYYWDTGTSAFVLSGTWDGLATPLWVDWLSSQLAGDNLLIGTGLGPILEWDPGAGTLAPITGAPAAWWLASFGDRIIAGGDSSSGSVLSWSADGIYNDWTGGDSGFIQLADSGSRAVDHIRGFGNIGDNVLAVIREASIYRAFETGNPLQAIGAVPWIEGIGSFAGNSIVQVPGGVVFLGSDFNFYRLTQNGLESFGDPIRDRLKELSDSDFPFRDSVAAYHPKTGDYVISLREDVAVFRGTFAVNLFDLSTGKIRWRELEGVEATALTPQLEEVSVYGINGFFYGNAGDSDIYVLTPEIQQKEGEGIFESSYELFPILSEEKGVRKRLLAVKVFFRDYVIGTEFFIDISDDGGNTWGKTVTVTTPGDFESESEITAPINVEAERLSLRFRFSSEWKIVLRGFVPIFAPTSTVGVRA